MTKIRATNGSIRVVIQSPYDAETREGRLENLKYARQVCRDSTNRGENPLASHLYYPQFLDNSIPEERADGIKFGYEWWPLCHKVIFYIDRGMSHGMLLAMQKAVQENKHLEMRRIFDGQPEVIVPPPPEEQTRDQDEHSTPTPPTPLWPQPEAMPPLPPPPPLTASKHEPADNNDSIARALERAIQQNNGATYDADNGKPLATNPVSPRDMEPGSLSQYLRTKEDY